jgi:hypothetical protein
MPVDRQNLQIALGIVATLLTILATVFGWFAKAWRWTCSLFEAKPPVGVIDVPTKTVILIPVARPDALWWHMGSMDSRPVMQIAGDLSATNISKFEIVLMGAKLRKPKASGLALVSERGSHICTQKNAIPLGAVSDLRFDFFVQPPSREKGEPFKADVAIIDQFGNEHWLKGLKFPYRD